MPKTIAGLNCSLSASALTTTNNRGNPSKTAFSPNLVKPPKPPNSPQAPDSAAEINLKNWRVYPSGFAMLGTEIKARRKLPSLRLFFGNDSSSAVFPEHQCPKPGSLHPDAFQRPSEALPKRRPRPAASPSP